MMGFKLGHLKTITVSKNDQLLIRNNSDVTVSWNIRDLALAPKQWGDLKVGQSVVITMVNLSPFINTTSTVQQASPAATQITNDAIAIVLLKSTLEKTVVIEVQLTVAYR